MKFIIFLVVFTFLKVEFFQAQNDTIKGKIFSSISKRKPKEDVYVFVKGTSNGTIVNDLGEFILVSKTKKESYLLEIFAGNYPNTIYKYKTSWSKRKSHKSIVVKGKCEINRDKARKDWKSGVPKLYLNGGIVPIANTKEDYSFEKKYNVEYVELGCEGRIYECVSQYNYYIIKILDIKYGREWRKTKRKEIVGMEAYKDSIKACLN
ncbi:hypothetical protein SAMN04489761_0991 [Tenacibaculum sp. MAR_2009_124]|uniref:FEKKY domain-containing protein n=1 Tax=Tenacibaculum sp. MAR_2009_124 TaxID=1250059 RepID=UPI000895ED2A|nr:hypothetical protein [Tenacibaculum sp. MAR_2009_124]SEB48604.1 hypothetical protein SAMN04489761_0991 [Tenacibaculum sp. MAR_2009_124]